MATINDIEKKFCQYVSPSRVRDTVERFAAAATDWKRLGRQGKIDLPYSQIFETVETMESLALTVELEPTGDNARLAQMRLHGSAGALARFPSIFRSGGPVDAPKAGQVIARLLEYGETIHRVAAAAKVDWQVIAELNNLRFPYTAQNGSKPMSGVLIEGQDMILVPAGRPGATPSVVYGNGLDNDLGTDFEIRESDGDFIATIGGNLKTIDGGDNVAQALTSQCKTVQGFFEELPDYGAHWLLPGRGLGSWFTTEWEEIFHFRIAKMITLDGRLSSPDAIETRFYAGVFSITFSAKTTSGREQLNLEILA